VARSLPRNAMVTATRIRARTATRVDGQQRARPKPIVYCGWSFRRAGSTARGNVISAVCPRLWPRDEPRAESREMLTRTRVAAEAARGEKATTAARRIELAELSSPRDGGPVPVPDFVVDVVDVGRGGPAAGGDRILRTGRIPGAWEALPRSESRSPTVGSYGTH
jgi:hypothetical protein